MARGEGPRPYLRLGHAGPARRRGRAAGALLGVGAGRRGRALMICWGAGDEPAWLHTLRVRLAGSGVGLLVAAAGYTYPVIRSLQRKATPAGGEHTWGPTLRRMLMAA